MSFDTATTIPTSASMSRRRAAPLTVQVVQHLRPGGIESLALDLASGPGAAADSLVLSLEGDQRDALVNWPRLAAFGSRLLFFGKAAGIRPGLVGRLAHFFRHHDVRVVHTHHVGPLLYAGLAARLAGVDEVIHTEHDAWHLEDRRRRWLQRLLIRVIRPRLVADADTVAANMTQHLGKRDIAVIRNGIDTQRFRPGDRIAARAALGLPQDKTVIGCSGRLEPVKGQGTLIAALARMPSHVHVALAGSGSCEQRLMTLVEANGLQARVHFLGHSDDMPRFYQALDLFCLPSFNEGFPLSVLEAQACAIPAAATDVGGTAEALCPRTGTLLPAGDAEAMASLLLDALQRRHATTPRQFVVDNNSLATTIEAYRALTERNDDDD